MTHKPPPMLESRLDELLRAEQLRRECEPQADSELTVADDCAALFEAWFNLRKFHGRVLLLDSEVAALARKMRALGRAK